MKNSFFYPIIFMTVITAVFIAVLATFNHSMTDTIAFNQESELRQKILYIFDILPDNEDPQEIKRVFDENVIEKEIKGFHVYALMEDNEEKAYAVPIDGAGLWGTITGYVGLSVDFNEILGIEFVTQSETPGLGGRIAEESYKSQFRNINIEGVTDGNYIISSPQSGNNVDAIAGATQTSVAVVKLINEDLLAFLKTQGVN